MKSAKNQKVKKLRPIRETPDDYESLRKYILKIFRDEIFLPLIKEASIPLSLKNSMDDIHKALSTGKIWFDGKFFRGSFSAQTSRYLKDLGAKWSPSEKAWILSSDKIPADLATSISVSKIRFEEFIRKIDRALSSSKISENINFDRFFDTTIFKTNKKVNQTLQSITVSPHLDANQVERMRKEYSENLNLSIKDFSEKEILELRQRIIEKSFQGVRYESVIDEIKSSYGVSERKAKFLARQETSLAMTKYKQVKYQDADVHEYEWVCRHAQHQEKGQPYKKGDVRYYHWKNNGKTFRWDNPPTVNAKGERKNPGQDYNCYCIAVPVVRFSD